MASDQSPMLNPAGIIERARRLVGGRRTRSIVAALLCLSAATFFMLLVTDGAIALPTWLRVISVPALAVTGTLGIIAILAAIKRFRPDAAAAAKMAESACADHERLLTTALELSRMPGELAAAGAVRMQQSLSLAGLADGLPKSRAGRWLALLFAVGALTAAVHLVLPAFFPAVLPRFLDPNGDHPPFSLIHLEWLRSPARARVGDNVRFEVSVSDTVEGIVLCALPLDGDGAQTRVPMFRCGANQFAGELSAVSSAMRCWAEAGGTRTLYHALALDPIPVLQTVDLRIDAPAYARLEAESRRVKSGEQAEFAVLPHSGLTIYPHANRPLAAIFISRDEQNEQRQELIDGSARFADIEPGSYALTLETTDGIRSNPIPFARLNARIDQPPRGRITTPAHDAYATADMVVPLAFSADDDLGLDSVHRSHEYNQLPAPQLRDYASGRSWQKDMRLDLGELGVAPGDVLTFTVVAEDTLPGDGQYSAPVRRQISIVSEAEFNKLLLRRIKPTALEDKYRPLIAELRELEKKMAELKKAARAGEKDAIDREFAELAKAAHALESKVQNLKRKTPLFAIEPDIQEQLAQAAAELAEAAEKKDPSKTSAGSVADMLEHDLALMRKIARGNGLIARLRQLIDAEQNTTERLGPLAEHRHLSDVDRVQLRSLAQLESELADALDQWQTLAEKVVTDLRETDVQSGPGGAPAAAKAADDLEALSLALGQTGAAELKRQAAASGRAGDGSEARRLAAEARDRLLALLPQCSRCCGGEASLSLSWCSGAGLANSMSCLNWAAGNGYGLGGIGSAGFGFALGYGGDDLAGSLPSMAMDLFGPENMADLGGQAGDNGSDGIAASAAGTSAAAQQPAAYRQATRTTTTSARSALSPAQQRVVDDYYRNLEEKR
jgi:hypothetical protein